VNLAVIDDAIQAGAKFSNAMVYLVEYIVGLGKFLRKMRGQLSLA
jgi:hypothetical protein